MIQITCKGNSAICTRTERLTSGMVGLQCEFVFDGAWDGLARTAVFWAGNEKRDVLLTGDTCTVPWEVLKTAGYQLVIGVYGTNAEGTLVIPTCYAMCGSIAPGADPSGEESTDPTLPVWGQLQGMIGNLDDLATASKDNLVAAINEAAQSGGGGGTSGGGHWETVLDTVWEQDVINPTAFDAATGIFTCAAGELDNLELNTEYAFYSQCTKEGIAYNTILANENLLLTKLSDTTFSINVTPPTTFIVENVKFSKGAILAVENIDATKIRLTLDGQFLPTANKYNRPFYGAKVPYFGENLGYAQIRNAYQAYQQVTVEVESPYRMVGEILCGFHAPSNNGNYHFKHNSFCCPLVPGDDTRANAKTYFWNADGTKIDKLYSTSSPWTPDSVKLANDNLKIISGTKVKLERWVE